MPKKKPKLTKRDKELFTVKSNISDINYIIDNYWDGITSLPKEDFDEFKVHVSKAYAKLDRVI